MFDIHSSAVHCRDAERIFSLRFSSEREMNVSREKNSADDENINDIEILRSDRTTFPAFFRRFLISLLRTLIWRLLMMRHFCSSF